jgi:hypothetical protein
VWVWKGLIIIVHGNDLSVKRPDSTIKFALAFVMVVCLVVGYLEIQHRYNYGHYFTYGLHLDVTKRPSSIGIPGQINMYEAVLFNFTIIPKSIIACGYTSDTLQSGTAFPFGVQRWNNVTKSWENVFFANTEDFCHPVPLGMSDAERVSYTLLPGSSVEAVESEATGAREPFEHGDYARFVVITSFEEGSSVETVSSERFQIEDNVSHDDVQYRVKH